MRKAVFVKKYLVNTDYMMKQAELVVAEYSEYGMNEKNND